MQWAKHGNIWYSIVYGILKYESTLQKSPNRIIFNQKSTLHKEK